MRDGSQDIRGRFSRQSRTVPVFILAIFISVCLIGRSTAETEEGIWVVEQSENNVVIKLSLDGKRELARITGFNVPTDIDINPRDGSVWITDTGNGRVVKYSVDGKTVLLELKGFKNPYHSVLDLQENTIWVASSLNGEVVKYSLEGEEILRLRGMGELHEIQLSPFDRSIWVGEQTAKKFMRFSSNGLRLTPTQRRLGRPMHLVINPLDGTCWATFQYPGGVVKFSSQGDILKHITGFTQPYGITFNPEDSSVWVTDVREGVLINISADGEILKRIGGFDRCRGLSLVDTQEKTFWMANWGAGEIIKFSTQGGILQRIKVGGHPRFMVIYKKNG